MLDEKIVRKLKERYCDLHPLLFHRSFERAKSDVELFDILDSIPKNCPVSWCEKENRWIKTEDFYQHVEFLNEFNQK